MKKSQSEHRKVSIVIPCYNEHLYIEQAIDSALAQTWSNKEIIVVDDGSNERTKELLERLKPKINLLLTQPNKGVSTARNEGIKHATGEFILVLDSDDYFEPEFCEKAIDIFSSNNRVRIVTCYSRWFDNTGSKIFKPTGGNIKDILLKNTAMGSSMFQKMSWEKAGGYDEKMIKGYEDWEFYIRVLQNDGFVKVIPLILFNYRNKPNSRNKKAHLEKFDILQYVYLKHEELYKNYFAVFITEWLKSNKKSEAFKQRVMESIDYKLGNKLLRPFRACGFFKK